MVLFSHWGTYDARAIGSENIQFAMKSSFRRKHPTQPKWRNTVIVTSLLDLALSAGEDRY
jgi:hypothetical protein